MSKSIFNQNLIKYKILEKHFTRVHKIKTMLHLPFGVLIFFKHWGESSVIFLYPAVYISGESSEFY